MPPRDATEEKYLERVCERAWAEREIAEVEQHCLFELRAMGPQRATVDPAKYVDTALRERLVEEMTSHDDLRSQIAKLEESQGEEKGQRAHDLELLPKIRESIDALFDEESTPDLIDSATRVASGHFSFADLLTEVMERLTFRGTKRQSELEAECAELRAGAPATPATKKDDKPLRDALKQAAKLTDELQKARALADQAQSAARSSEERLAPALEEVARLRAELEEQKGLVLKVQEPTKKKAPKTKAPRAPKAPRELPLWDLFTSLSQAGK